MRDTGALRPAANPPPREAPHPDPACIPGELPQMRPDDHNTRWKTAQSYLPTSGEKGFWRGNREEVPVFVFSDDGTTHAAHGR